MTDVIPAPQHFKTDCGLEYSLIDGYGFADKNRRPLTDKEMAIALTHYHCNKAQENYIHWAWRLAAVVGGWLVVPEAMPVVILFGAWTEYVRHRSGEQGHSQGIVSAIERFSPHYIEANRGSVEKVLAELRQRQAEREAKQED